MRLILLGAPGAGKGTQADVISAKLNIPTISTGNILRAAVKAGTPIGKQAEGYMKAGQLVPDEVIIGIMQERLKEDDCKNGYILDGMPRTIPQAEALVTGGVEIDCALSIEIADETIVERMSGRRTCPDCGASYHIVNSPSKVEGICDKCGAQLVIRADDKAETVKARLVTYHKETEPLKDFYARMGKLKTVDNQPSIAETSEAIFRVLGI